MAVKTMIADDILSDRMSEILAGEIAKEIDEGIISTLLTTNGWIRVDVDCGWLHKGKATDTAEWLHLNAVGDYRLLHGFWHFKDPRDATAFALKWA